MRQDWKKLGHVFVAGGEFPWMASHASYPVATPLDVRSVRVYFSPRDGENRSHIAALDLALDGDRFEILRLHERPVLSPGPRGAFDDSGVTVGNIVELRGRHFLYYLGWSLSITVPFRNFIGLAVAEDGAEDFQRVSPAPVLDRSKADPYSLGYPWVVETDDGLAMWYGSHLRWADREGENPPMLHVIKRANSTDGVRWEPQGDVALDVAEKAEWGLSRPCVMRDGETWRMWYARRYATYRMGYAESRDGVNWRRKDDEVGIEPSPSGWDSESVCYASVFDHAGARYMLYNGNGYGRTGFGLARLAA